MAGTEIVDLQGATVVPGFHDAHMHLSSGSMSRTWVDLRAASSAEDAARILGDAAASCPKPGWIRGFGWDQTRWPGSEWPHRFQLDATIPDRPVVLSRVDGHAAWVNSRALAALEIEARTVDPAGGSIGRDPRSGEPTGILLERAAEAAFAAVPLDPEADRRIAIEDMLRVVAASGLTAVGDVIEPWALPIYGSLLEQGRLTVRVDAWLPIDTEPDEAERWRRTFPPDDPWISVGTLKAYLDGTLGSRSAALHEPYADDGTSRGLLRVDPERLAARVRDADHRGWAVAMHAIGDRAVSLALDVLEGLPEKVRSRPHRIEHAQVVSPADMVRFAAVAAVASLQPVHFLDDAPWILDRLGAVRAARAYPLRSLLSSGAALAFGSDWPIASLNPVLALAAATRPHSPADPVGRNEALTLGQALAACTAGAAAARGQGDRLGLLTPGFWADFVLLSEDPFSVPPSEIVERVSVRSTFVAGRRVHPEAEPV